MGQCILIHRISNRTKDYDARHLEAVRAAIAHGKHVLEDSDAASTFAGRKTQEPFPKETEPKQ
ncbi:MAG TPA: hypothetical protein VMM15_19370 [Bradyrhizobium sp.]|nr:hypothetical protein [Bradyrhizobium sp.]